jgi:uncharacterized protein Veg
MNLEDIKKEVNNNLGRSVEIKVYGTRNKSYILVGKISNVYPNIFTVLENEENHCFQYADIITGEIKMKYL